MQSPKEIRAARRRSVQCLDQVIQQRIGKCRENGRLHGRQIRMTRVSMTNMPKISLFIPHLLPLLLSLRSHEQAPGTACSRPLLHCSGQWYRHNVYIPHKPAPSSTHSSTVLSITATSASLLPGLCFRYRVLARGHFRSIDCLRLMDSSRISRMPARTASSGMCSFSVPAATAVLIVSSSARSWFVHTMKEAADSSTAVFQSFSSAAVCVPSHGILKICAVGMFLNVPAVSSIAGSGGSSIW
jgi:hypothetical protein